MSARTVRDDWSESLTDAYWAAVHAPTNPEAADKTLALLDAYAHELAEKIREDTTVMGEAGDQYALAYADLIDPEKEA